MIRENDAVEQIISEVKEILRRKELNTNDLYEALEIIESFTKENYSLIFQKAKVLRMIGELEKSIDILKNSREILVGLPRTYIVTINLVKCLCNLAELEENIEYVIEAKKLIVEHGINDFPGNIVNRVNNDIRHLSSSSIKRSNESTCEIRNIYTDIYTGNILFDDIEKSQIDDWDKEVLLLAYLEKYNKKLGLKLVSKLKEKYKDNEIRIKQLNKIHASLESNKSLIFDLDKYGAILDVSIDFDRVNSFKQKEELKVKELEVEKTIKPVVSLTKKEIVEVVVPKKEAVKPKQIISASLTSTNICPKVKKHKDYKTKEKKELLIRDVYVSECEDIGSYLYSRTSDVETRQKWIVLLDNFYALSSYSVNDKEKVSKFIKVVNAFNELNIINSQADINRINKVKKLNNE